jgi:ABC-type nitrate/sulfonate/bicarbonate transport system permease component
VTARRLLGKVNPAGWLVVAALIGLWQLAVDTGVLDYEYLPSATEVAGAFGDLLSSGVLADDVRHTLLVTLGSSAIACVVGVVLGFAVALLPIFDRLFTASFDLLRTIPVIALMPVAMLIWGPAAHTEVIVATYGATWPILVNTAGGVRTVHPRLHEVARMFRFSRRRTLRWIVLPAALPDIVVGARLAVVTALVITIIAEMLVNAAGLGWGLVMAQQALQPAQMWAYAIAAGILGYLLNLVLIQAARRSLPGSAAFAEAA